MLSARVLARYHRLTPLPDGVDPAKLGPELHTVCGQPFRRTDRFTRLALLGSAHCVAGQQLAASCGVYLGSFTGPLESNIRVQQQLLAERELPRPFDFVNTLGSVACFHVAQNLSLTGPVVFVSRGGHCLEAALELALTDLALGLVPQALVGVVEEAPLPLAAQRQRLGLPENTVLAEGSHWLLLQAGHTQLAEGDIELHRFDSPGALAARLRDLPAGTSIAVSRHASSDLRRMVLRHCPTATDLADWRQPFHASSEAAWVLDRLVTTAGAVALVHGNDDGGCLLKAGGSALVGPLAD